MRVSTCELMPGWMPSRRRWAAAGPHKPRQAALEGWGSVHRSARAAVHAVLHTPHERLARDPTLEPSRVATLVIRRRELLGLAAAGFVASCHASQRSAPALATLSAVRHSCSKIRHAGVYVCGWIWFGDDSYSAKQPRRPRPGPGLPAHASASTLCSRVIDPIVGARICSAGG